MAGLSDRGIRGSLERMLRMDQVHVVRHKVLVEGRSQRAVARELGLSRMTVGKYLDQAAPARKAAARPRRGRSGTPWVRGSRRCSPNPRSGPGASSG